MSGLENIIRQWGPLEMFGYKMKVSDGQMHIFLCSHISCLDTGVEEVGVFLSGW